MSAHAQPLWGKLPARLARALERAIPQPLLAIPPLMLALGLLAIAHWRINGRTWHPTACSSSGDFRSCP
jgi:hypothetical protein